MKAVLTYWIIGCVIFGPAVGHKINKCPNDHIDMGEIVGSIAIWPAAIIAVWSMTKAPNTACKVQP